jgi:hypothetical protein
MTMIKIETAIIDGLRYARISDGIHVNVSATEGEVDQLICQLVAWRGNKGFVDVVFDGPPAHESGRFVEVENADGYSINVGEWIDRGNGLWSLRVPYLAPEAPKPAKAGDVYDFQYPKEAQFNKKLRVVSTQGDGPEDLVFFEDGSHSKQRKLVGVPRVPA